MKSFASIFRTFPLLLFALFFAGTKGLAANEVGTEYFDSVEIGLVTCTPHEEIYSLYGHTALRVRDLHTNEDVAFNYGVFNYNQPYFVARFILGKTDYELGIAPFGEFCRYYRRWGSQVSEQLLNLTAEEKRSIMTALAVNYRPENRVYRYNFFFDNCATHPRNVIERCINGRVEYPVEKQEEGASFRQLIHEHTALHPWVTTGIDLLLGVRADRTTTGRERQFLPRYLERDFDQAVIHNPDGSVRPMVKTKRVVVSPSIQRVEEDFPLSPLACGIILLSVSMIIFVLEWRRKRTMVWWDVALMLTAGLAGTLLFVMLFSEHPTTSTNLQVLLLNPLHLVFIPAIVRRKRGTPYWNLLLAMVLLLLTGGLWQHYAEGMYFVALCLLIRYWSHFRNDK